MQTAIFVQSRKNPSRTFPVNGCPETAKPPKVTSTIFRSYKVGGEYPSRGIPGNLAHPRGLLVRVHGAGSCEEGEAQPGYDRIKDYARGWYG